VSYLFDTNVVSEIQKRNSNPQVIAFIGSLEPDTLYTSAVTIGELSIGVERLPTGKKKTELLYFIDTQVPEWFGNRIIPLDSDIMREWGRICAHTGRTLPIMDSLIAATAITRRLILLTRNTQDFDGIENLLLLNPWEEG
jgi:predicted nucleic acid-binding protein